MRKVLIVSMVTAMVIAADAGVIGVSLDNNASTAPGMEATDLAGAPGVRVGNWNGWFKDDVTLGDDGLDILDDSGATVGLIGTISSGSRASRDNNHDNDQEMFSDVIDVTSGGITVSLTNIPYASYDVYIYMRDDGVGRAGSFTIGSTTYYAEGGAGIPGSDGSGYVLSSDINSADGITAGNYVRFANLSGSVLDMSMAGINTGNLDRNKVAGFQIVQIPEPATIGLLGLTGIGLFVSRRFRV